VKEINYEELAEKYLDLYMGGIVKDYFMTHEKEAIRNFARWLNRGRNNDKEDS
jgi:hypothetical protein